LIEHNITNATGQTAKAKVDITEPNVGR